MIWYVYTHMHIDMYTQWWLVRLTEAVRWTLYQKGLVLMPTGPLTGCVTLGSQDKVKRQILSWGCEANVLLPERFSEKAGRGKEEVAPGTFQWSVAKGCWHFIFSHEMLVSTYILSFKKCNKLSYYTAVEIKVLCKKKRDATDERIQVAPAPAGGEGWSLCSRVSPPSTLVRGISQKLALRLGTPHL